MFRNRVIPFLLLRHEGFVKTRQFRDPTYLGDPVNIVRIFNDKEADELAIFDICASLERKRPNFDLLKDIASECFMPLCYGGGIRSLDDIRILLSIGFEKVCLNTYAVENPEFVRRASDMFGSQSIVVAIDVKKSFFGKYEVLAGGGRKKTGLEPVQYARKMEELGAGEIVLCSIDRDGTMKGYDLQLILQVASAVSIPVIAGGGAGTASDLGNAVSSGGASAAAAGSMFVFYGSNRAVLINMPSARELESVFCEKG